MGCWRGRRLSSAATRGYVAKDETSPYTGGPTRAWVKVRQWGWTDAEDRVEDSIRQHRGRLAGAESLAVLSRA
jgi:hypothetical protein